MKIQCLVLDKSPSQQRVISKIISNNRELELISVFSSSLELKKNIDSLDVELLIIDINMPDINGFEVLKLFKHTPEVIFMADSKKHAYHAIKYHPVDYLTKPIDTKECQDALKKAIDVVQKNRLQNQKDQAFIRVTSDAKNQRIKLDDILWIEALGDYVCIMTHNNKKTVVHSTMYAFEERLPQNQFIRIHKSYIVNQNKILSYNSREVDLLGKKLPLSRSKKPILDSYFMESF